jgi:glycosyltransferase involved in cell wall biosynthesis
LDKPLRLLTVADLHWRYGHEFAVHAVWLLRQSGIEVYYQIVGNGPSFESVAFARHNFGMSDSIELLSTSNSCYLDFLYAQAHLYIACDVAPNVGIGLKNAIELSLPIVTTDVTSDNGVFSEKSVVAVVPRRDPWAMALRIKEWRETNARF